MRVCIHNCDGVHFLSYRSNNFNIKPNVGKQIDELRLNTGKAELKDDA